MASAFAREMRGERPFARQFLIDREADPEVPGFRNRKLCAGWWLHSAPDLPAIELVANGEAAGFLLGFPVDLVCGRLLDDGARLEIGDTGYAKEQLYERLAGSFVMLLEMEGGPRLFLDACASLSVVFDRKAREIAATAALLLGEDYDVRLRPELMRAFEVAGDGWASADLTAHEGVERLLPNHYLDLADFTVHRHWPVRLPAYVEDPMPTVQAIGAEIAMTCTALAQAKPTSVALTGGFETRVLLACNRALSESARFVTVATPASRRDVFLARELASLAGLDHSVLPGRMSTTAQAEHWSYLAGHCVGGSNRDYFPSVAPLAGEVLIGGAAGEVGRGFLWPPDLTAHERPSARRIVDLCKLPRDRQLLARVECWLAGLPDGLDSWQLLDLAYVELRMASWAFAQAWADPVKLDIYPFISRRQFTRMLSLPPDFRKQDGLMRALVSEFWPGLLDIPVNAYGDWRDLAVPFARALRNPRAAVRKFRQLVRR